MFGFPESSSVKYFLKVIYSERFLSEVVSDRDVLHLHIEKVESDPVEAFSVSVGGQGR